MNSQMAHAVMNDTPDRSRVSLVGWFAVIMAAGLIGYLMFYHVSRDHAGAEHATHAPPLWGLGVLPFLGILGSIAILPLIHRAHHWWESNINRLLVSLVCAGLTLLYYGMAVGGEAILPVLDHAIPGEYIPFIMLLFSLYVISGGINLTGDLAAHPLTTGVRLPVLVEEH